jgi:hypothetical protein
MSQTTDKMPPSRKKGRPPLYDWDSCFDGDVHIFYKGEDFDVDIESFRALVHRTANTRVEGGPWKAETRLDRNAKSVAFRFFNPQT